MKPIAHDRKHRLATAYQLWRLNEQGLLLFEIAEDAFVPGGPPEGWTSIGWEDARALLARADEERWRGLPTWPKRGEQWCVRDGRVVSLGMALDDEPRT